MLLKLETSHACLSADCVQEVSIECMLVKKLKNIAFVTISIDKDTKSPIELTLRGFCCFKILYFIKAFNSSIS